MLESLNIKTSSPQRGQVNAEMALEEAGSGGEGQLCEALILALAQAANLRGAGAGAKGQGLRLLESRTSFFEPGEGDRLFAEARQVHDDGELLLWRASIYRGQAGEPRRLVAEVSQTLRRLPAAEAAAAAQPREEAPLPAAAAGRAEAARVKSGAENSQASSVSERRRRQIFDGACAVIMRNGYGATTIREIAKAADISIPTMYQYIKSKEDILFMITKGCMEEIFESFKEAQGSGGSARQKMERAIDSYISYIGKNRRYINLVYRETKSLSQENRDRIFQIEREFCSLWEKIIQDGNESGEFQVENTTLAANLVYFFCNVWALRHWSIGQFEEAEVRAWLSRFIMRGLEAEPRPGAQPGSLPGAGVKRGLSALG